MLSRCRVVEAGVIGGAAFGGAASCFEILCVVDLGCELFGGALGDTASCAGFSDLVDIVSLGIQLVGALASGTSCDTIAAATGAALGVAGACEIGARCTGEFFTMVSALSGKSSLAARPGRKCTRLPTPIATATSAKRCAELNMRLLDDGGGSGNGLFGGGVGGGNDPIAAALVPPADDLPAGNTGGGGGHANCEARDVDGGHGGGNGKGTDARRGGGQSEFDHSRNAPESPKRMTLCLVTGSSSECSAKSMIKKKLFVS